MGSARVRLASLWLSQTARVLADWCLRMFVILELARLGDAEKTYAWHLVTALFMLPFVLLAPLNGALCNSLPKRAVLVGAANWCLLVTALFAWLHAVLGWSSGPWLGCVALVAVGSAVYSPARYGLLPAAAVDTGWPLARITSWIELGGGGAIVAGIALAWTLDGVTWAGQVPVTVLVSAGLSLLAVLAALPVRFAADVRRPEQPAQAVAGFFRDARRVWQEPAARGSLLGLACFLALIAAGSGAVVAYTLGPDFHADPGLLLRGLVYVCLGTAAGSLVAGVQGHPTRMLGLVPLGATGLLAALAWAAGTAHLEWPCLLLGFMGGLANVPLRTAYQDSLPADARGNGMAISNTANFTLIALLSVAMFGLSRSGLLASGLVQLWFLAGCAAVGALIAWRFCYRDAVELVVDVLNCPLYRVRAHGPGLQAFPRRGPVLVVANHAAWFDPVWLAKVLPRHLTPMMTSIFYDRPFLRFLVTHIVRSIRVEATGFRREAPELQEAIAALDRGECVLIFPEGRMRRREEQALRHFGQGVWHILHQRPRTPVVACWIEGGWGSYASYRGGPPATNKPVDRRRPIDVAVTEPQVLDAELLADQRATREHLMHACLDARRLLGLEALAQPGAEPAAMAEE